MRHVSPAFAEDPVRILRVARFAARFADFTVAPETLALMRDMVAAGEVDALVPERVWQELARGLMEDKPSRMFEVLRECGALARLLPELDALWGVPQRADYHPEIDTGVHVMMVIDMAARLGAALPARFAALTHDLGKGAHAGRHPAAPPRPRSEKRGPARSGLRTPARAGRLPRRRPPGGALPRRHASRRRTAAGNAIDPARTLRCAAPAGALRTDPARLRGGLSRPAGLGRARLRAGRDLARGAGGGTRGRCRGDRARAGGRRAGRPQRIAQAVAASARRCPARAQESGKQPADKRRHQRKHDHRGEGEGVLPAAQAEAQVARQAARPSRRPRRGCSRPTTTTVATRTINHFSIDGAR
jgi:tRNA nucleotidyltransferase (CCA-adding enzyme)